MSQEEVPALRGGHRFLQVSADVTLGTYWRPAGVLSLHGVCSLNRGSGTPVPDVTLKQESHPGKGGLAQGCQTETPMPWKRSKNLPRGVLFLLLLW